MVQGHDKVALILVHVKVADVIFTQLQNVKIFSRNNYSKKFFLNQTSVVSFSH